MYTRADKLIRFDPNSNENPMPGSPLFPKVYTHHSHTSPTLQIKKGRAVARLCRYNLSNFVDFCGCFALWNLKLEF